jgi:invasion protein IalB
MGFSKHRPRSVANRGNPFAAGFGRRLGAGLTATGFAIALFLGLTGVAQAQGAVRSVHGDWQIRCDTPPGAQGEQCALIQSVVAEDRSNAGLTVIMLKTADQKSRLMRVVAPLGVLLPSGLGLKLDNVDVGRAGFVRCLPNGRQAVGSAPYCQDRDFYHFRDAGRGHRVSAEPERDRRGV